MRECNLVEDFIVPVIFLIVLFVGFGLAHRRGQSAPGCAGCTTCAVTSAGSHKVEAGQQ
jgi:hypothetical protein